MPAKLMEPNTRDGGQGPSVMPDASASIQAKTSVHLVRPARSLLKILSCRRRSESFGTTARYENITTPWLGGIAGWMEFRERFCALNCVLWRTETSYADLTRRTTTEY